MVISARYFHHHHVHGLLALKRVAFLLAVGTSEQFFDLVNSNFRLYAVFVCAQVDVDNIIKQVLDFILLQVWSKLLHSLFPAIFVYHKDALLVSLTAALEEVINS